MSIEEHIRQAMSQGKFDDLPGKGQPLNLDENPLEDPEWRLTHHMLRSSGFTLPWIEMRKEIEDEIEAARAALKRAWEWRVEALSLGQPGELVENEWKRAANAFRERVGEINQHIDDYNLQAPTEGLQRPKLNVEREIESLGAE
jgi:DnaJ family protein C protein 28